MERENLRKRLTRGVRRVVDSWLLENVDQLLDIVQQQLTMA